MTSASKYWIFLLFVFFLLSCGSNKPHSRELTPMKKAYILVRTEGNNEDISQFKDILNSDFIANNIAPKIETSALQSSWNTNQIFSTAYNDNYDYIMLIDQVAKFTIDQRTKVGGKYQIRSYDIKSANPDWLDLGQLTCNMTVKPSIQKFAGQVVSKIVPNYKPSLTFLDNEETSIVNTDYVPSDKLKPSSELDKEIEKLKQQLKLEKEKTEKALEEKIQLERNYQEQLAIEKQKADLAIANFEALKKSKTEAEAEQLRKESESNRQKELAETYANKREEILRREAIELKNNPPKIVSVSKDTSSEVILNKRKEAKQAIIEERALNRKKAQEAAAKRIEDRKKLVEAKREDQKRIRAELERKRQEQKRLAKVKRQEKLAAISQTRIEKTTKTENNLLSKNEQDSILMKDSSYEKPNDNKVSDKARIDQEIIDKQKVLFQERRKKESLKEERRLAKLENEEEKKKKRELDKAQRLEEQLSAKKNKETQNLTLERTKEGQTEQPENITPTAKSNDTQNNVNKKSFKAKEEPRGTTDSNNKLSKEEKRLAKDEMEQEEYERKQKIKDQRRLAKSNSGKAIELMQTPKNSEVKNSISSTAKIKLDSNRVLIIIQGNKEDQAILKNLQDKLVLELSVKKINSTSFILNNKDDFNQQNIINQNKSTYKLIVIINQLNDVEDGIFDYKISTFDYINSTWYNYDSEPYNTEKRNSIKSITKKIVTKL